MARRLNEQAVLDVIYSRGPTRRTEVAQATGLSKPTVSSIVEDLVATGLVHTTGRTQGDIGRSAALYEVNAAVGHVVGVDLGGTKVRAAVCDLFGTILSERVQPTDPTGPDAVIRQIVKLAADLAADAEIEMSTVRVLSVATPGTVDPRTGKISLAYNIPSFADVNLASRLAEGSGCQVVLDNDVNMAAVGERWQGLARQCDNFAFLAIGTGIGMGLMLGGEIWQGHGGAAGEIGYLPLGRDPFDPAVRKRGAFEEAAAGRGLAGRYREALELQAKKAPGDLTAETVFEAAAGGDDIATEAIEAEARVVASGIAAVNAVIAPEMVVLGGGVGANPMLLEPVRRYVAELVPSADLRVETSALSHRASLFGSLAIGLQSARAIIFPAPPRGPGDGEPGGQPRVP
jgi:glucokinase